MQVETYEVTELTTAEREPLDPDAVEMIEALGLEGQRRFVGTAGDNETPAVIPYRLMSEEELRVYRTLFPERTALQKYSGEPIPLRVLQVASHAKGLSDLRKLEVWHPKAGTEYRDPLLVGEAGQHSWNPDFYLLARWGDVLLPFEELRDLAAKKLSARWQAEAQEVRSRADGLLSSLDSRVRSYLHGNGSEPNWDPAP
jgi:hypothetical protein